MSHNDGRAPDPADRAASAAGPPNGPASHPEDAESLLSLRAAVVLLLALLTGAAAAFLARAAGQSLPAAVLVGGGATGAALPVLNTLIGGH